MEQSTADISGGGNGEEVKEYKIHVSSKYLDLTKKKLELTRLPHELLVPRAREWEFGTPKSEIEPLIDFWLEHYSWRSRENTLNANLPQFRTAISLPSLPHPSRVHFIHIKSSHAHAIPLLLLPSFPLANLSPLLAPLFKPLTEPDLPTSQPFHVVLPSIPGLGFSDALQSDDGLLALTAEIFDVLMKRLGYEFYLASSTGSGRLSPSGIDFHLARLLAENFPGSCLGTHLIEPVVDKPGWGSWGWLKFSVAKFFHANLFGYTSGDFKALRESTSSLPVAEESDGQVTRRQSYLLKTVKGFKPGFGAISRIGLREPNTFSYALCDSPVGLLSLVCSALRKVSPRHTLNSEEIIDTTQMAWLPGPEAGLRFWSVASEEARALSLRRKPNGRKARVAVTVFENGAAIEEEAGSYVCPAWVGERFDVLFAQRAEGRAGLVAYEKTKVVVEGIRDLARVVKEVDGRLRLEGLDSVVVGGRERGQTPEMAEDGWEVESPDTVVNVGGRG